MGDDRRAIAQECVDLHVKHADVFRKIDELKEALRAFAEASADDPEEIRTALRKLVRDELAIDDLKTRLRELGQAGRDGFKEDFPGRGLVVVTNGSAAKFKGIFPVLDAAAFLKLPDKQRERLLADKIVAMEHQFSEARRPSVSVKL